MNNQNELSFDGRGINGPDAYRSRVATFSNSEYAAYGPLFEASPEMLRALRDMLKTALCVDDKEWARAIVRAGTDRPCDAAQTAIKRAEQVVFRSDTDLA